MVLTARFNGGRSMYCRYKTFCQKTEILFVWFCNILLISFFTVAIHLLDQIMRKSFSTDFFCIIKPDHMLRLALLLQYFWTFVQWTWQKVAYRVIVQQISVSVAAANRVVTKVTLIFSVRYWMLRSYVGARKKYVITQRQILPKLIIEIYSPN